MYRKRQHLLRELATLPWWIGLVFAVIVYVALRWGFPVIAGRSVVLKSLADAFSGKAALFTAPFLAVTVIAALNAYRRRKLLDNQSGLDSLKAATWQDFELIVGEAFRRQGYTVEEAGGAAPDGGIDLILFRAGKKTIVQCKRWKRAQVGVTPTRELYGVMIAEHADRGMLVSSGVFTDDAKGFASGKPIDLIDGRALAQLIKGVQPPDKLATTRPVAAAQGLLCPICSVPMTRRLAKRGSKAGEAFWGCTRFPECKGTRSL